MGIECITDVIRRGRLRWFSHAQRREDTAWMKRCIDIEVDGRRNRGGPKLTWMELVKKDMERCDLRTRRTGVVRDRVASQMKIA